MTHAVSMVAEVAQDLRDTFALGMLRTEMAQCPNHLRDTVVVVAQQMAILLELRHRVGVIGSIGRMEGIAEMLRNGAHGNWRYLNALAPEATAVVDFYHAAEQLKSAFDARYGENDARGRVEFHKLRHLLLDDPHGVEKVIRALDYQRKKFPRRTRIGEVLRYFRRNRHRMRYADTQARHLPIGSGVGVVEAACKTLVTQRLKRSGMRWRRPGGQAILTLRALIQSSRFDQAMLSETYRQEVIVPGNVVAFPCKRAA